MSENKYADVTIFPDHNIIVRTPAGREYRGKVLVHPSQHATDENWLQVQFLKGQSKDDMHASAMLEQQFRKSGRPDYFAAASTVEPLAVAFNRIPAAKRTEKNTDTMIGDLWDADGLWTLLIKPSKSEKVLFAGSAVPAPAELTYTASKIAQHRRAQRPGEHGGDETNIVDFKGPSPA